jgi:hypothetical protein
MIFLVFDRTHLHRVQLFGFDFLTERCCLFQEFVLHVGEQCSTDRCALFFGLVVGDERQDFAFKLYGNFFRVKKFWADVFLK